MRPGLDNGKDNRSGSNPGVVRVAAVGDLHCTGGCQGVLEPLLEQIGASADVLVLCGDLTDHGLPEEATLLARELSTVSKLPTLAVLGNHDYESGHVEEVRHILTDAGVFLLDGDSKEVHGVGFAGVKGFAGGFGRGTLSAFGEPAIKRFVQESLDEVMKLEAALARLHTPRKIAVLHYAPIQATVDGEPKEIWSFLGSGRLEEPLNRYQVTACVHGHAHKGGAEGKTSAGLPVYNVSMHVMRHNYPDHPPFRLLNVPVDRPQHAAEPHRGEKPVETEVS